MIKNLKIYLITIIGLIALCVATLFYPNAHTEAFSDVIAYPTVGLHCAQPNKIVSASEKFVLSQDSLSSDFNAVKESEYKVIANKDVAFQIPFFSSFYEVPQFDVTVNGNKISGKVFYGEIALKYQQSSTYFSPVNNDNTIIKQMLNCAYSTVLDDNIIGVAYTLTPDNDNVNVEFELAQACGYIYDDVNIRSNTALDDGRISLIYDGAMSHKEYKYFFAGENSVIDFYSNCRYEKHTVTFKQFIDANFSQMNFTNAWGDSSIDYLYSLANKLIDQKNGVKYRDFFNYSFHRVSLNIFRFTLPFDGEATVRYSNEATLQRNCGFSPTVYTIGHKQLGDYATDYTIVTNDKLKYVIQSSVKTKKRGDVYTAKSTQNFYFICSASQKPVNFYARDQSDSDVDRRIKAILCISIGGLTIIIGFCIFLLATDKKV